MHFADAMGNIYFSTAMPPAATCAVVLLNPAQIDTEKVLNPERNCAEATPTNSWAGRILPEEYGIDKGEISEAKDCVVYTHT